MELLLFSLAVFSEVIYSTLHTEKKEKKKLSLVQKNFVTVYTVFSVSLLPSHTDLWDIV